MNPLIWTSKLVAGLQPMRQRGAPWQTPALLGVLAALLVACGGAGRSGEGGAAEASATASRARALAVVPAATAPASNTMQVGGTYALRLVAAPTQFMQAPATGSPAPVSMTTLAAGAEIPVEAQFVALPSVPFGTALASCFALRTKVVDSQPWPLTMEPSAAGNVDLPTDRYMGTAASGRLEVRSLVPGSMPWGRVFCTEAATGGRGFMLRPQPDIQLAVRSVDGQIVATVPDGTAEFKASALWEAVVITAPGQAQPPTVAIRGSTDGSVATAGLMGTALKIDADDADGAVVKVEIFDGATLVGVAYGQPYDVPVPRPLGSHRYYARATDQSGQWTLSAPFEFEVKAPAITPNDVAPQVSLSVTWPISTGEPSVAAGQTLFLKSTRTRGVASLQDRVEFLDGNEVFARGDGSLTSAQWIGAVGVHTLSVRVTDMHGQTASSAPLRVTVPAPASGAPQPPSIRWVAPALGATAVEGTTQRLVAEPGIAAADVRQISFYDGDELVGTVSQAPYTVGWTPRRGQHLLSAVVTDKVGLLARSAVANFVATTGVPPEPGRGPDDFIAKLHATAPASGSVFASNQQVTLGAAVDSVVAGDIERVEFFVYEPGTSSVPSQVLFVGEARAAPYSVVWGSPRVGNWGLLACAVSTAGRGRSSMTGSFCMGPQVAYLSNPAQETTFIVKEPVVPAGLAQITSPLSGTALELGQGLIISANAVGSDGTWRSVSQLRVEVDGVVIATLQGAAEYRAKWMPSSPGSYVLRTVAVESGTGRLLSSLPVKVAVVAPGSAVPPDTAHIAPRVALTAPLDGARVATGSAVAVTAAVSTTGGTITEVWFRSNRGEAQLTSAPWSRTWTASGSSATVWAEATDSFGTTVFSPSATVTVTAAPSNQPPQARLLVPNAPTSVPLNTRFTLQAEASDVDGRVVKLEFIDNGRVMSTLTAAPWTLSGTATWAGAHRLQVRATDDRGAVTTSAASTVQVLPAQ